MRSVIIFAKFVRRLIDDWTGVAKLNHELCRLLVVLAWLGIANGSWLANIVVMDSMEMCFVIGNGA